MSPAMSLTAIGLVIVATIGIGLFGLRISRTTSDFYVASRAVSPRWNASAISGEYLSAASFLGVAGLVLVNGADMLWFSVGYTVGYLMLLVLIAAPLRRSGAYTLPDFAETRFESPRYAGSAPCLVVGIGTLYLLPQFSGAGLAVHDRHGRTALRRGCDRRGDRGDERRRRRHALDHLRTGLPVLAEAHRAGRADLRHPDASGTTRSAYSIPCTVRRPQWAEPLSRAGGRDHPLYATYSLLLALCFGTMGLPHVLVRFYTNPDGRAARRTTVVVLALLGFFYLFPPVYAVLGRIVRA